MKNTLILLILLLFSTSIQAQTAMTNVSGRNSTSLNGEWKVIVDPIDAGTWRQVWLEKKPEKNTDFFEYSFEEGSSFHVPGDFNTQMPEIFYMEGTVWYRKKFTHSLNSGSRYYLHFGAVNYLADVYLNGKLMGSHEGGFTPFQFEITPYLKNGINTVIVKVNNQRRKSGIPGLGYDWFNYGGITRDVTIIETGKVFVEDYFLQLKKHSINEVNGWIKLNEAVSKEINILIPELKVDYKAQTDVEGYASVGFKSKIHLWSPSDPKLYKVIILCDKDTIVDEIGFRNIEVKGTKVFLNGNPLFLKGVNIHEERPFKPSRACTREDAITLLNWARELGCNLVRLAHYPHNEYMVREAEKMGIMVWDEIPVYQHVVFSDPDFMGKMDLMMKEMIRRDHNRCNVIIWSLSNETYTDTPERTNVLVEMTKRCRLLDSTRLITSVLSNQEYKNNAFHVWDTLCRHLDVVCINEYLGWYVPWQGNPAETKWSFVVEKPLIISEFGGEAKYGNLTQPEDAASSWNEKYQEQIYMNQLILFEHTPNLVGLCPWLLVDYRSPVRMHPVYQNGYNRKGLLSETGEKKKAWYIMREFYQAR